jgi:uracil-DNA glycosylase family 4
MITNDTIGNHLGKVFVEVASCKAAGTCNRLTVRGNFFEPNPETIRTWQRVGLYAEGVDRRVVFVCESPSSTYDGTTPDFRVMGVGGYRTWAGRNHRTNAFLEMRRQYRLENCLITNVAKCGCPGSVKNKPTSLEAERCSRFLAAEINAQRPAVVACLGRKTMEYARFALSQLTFDPMPAQVYLTHYSAHMPPYALKREWAPQFDEIRREIEKRGLDPYQPSYS